jgi:signal transduction histidine kinase
VADGVATKAEPLPTARLSRRLLDEAVAGARRLGSLYAITEAAIANRTLDALLPDLLAEIRYALGADTAALLLIDDLAATLRVRASVGFEPALDEGTPIPRGQGFAGRICETRTPLLLDDVGDADLVQSRWLRGSVRSLLGVPLFADELLIGVLHVGARARAAFSQGELELLQLLSDRVGFAIEQARRYDALRRYARSRDELISFGVLAMSTEPSELLSSEAVRAVAAALEAEGAAILEQQADGSLQPSASVGLAVTAAPRIDACDLAGLLATKPHEARPRLPVEWLRSLGFASAVCAGIQGDDGRFRCIAAFSAKPSTFTEDQTSFLENISTILSLASARRRLEAQIVSERQRLETIIDALPVAVLLVDADGHLAMSNRAARAWGALPSNVADADVSVFDAEGRPMAPEARCLVRTLREGLSVESELVSIELPGGGGLRHLLFSTRPLRRPDGVVEGAVGAAADVSSALRFEREQKLLVEVGDRLAASFGAPSALPEVLVDSLALLGEAAALYLLELDARDAGDARDEARTREAAVACREGAGHCDALSALRRDPTPIVERALASAGPCEVASAPGYATIAVPIRSPELPLGVLVFTRGAGHPYDERDRGLASAIAYRIGLALENARLREEAERAATMRADLLAVASHDLRSPLSSIITTAQVLLRSKGCEDPKVVRQIEVMERNARRMSALIDGLLDLERIRRHGLQLSLGEHAVAALASEVIEVHAATAAAKGVDLRLAACADAGTARCDRERVAQALSNLVGNAIKFTPSGGHVLLRLDRETDGVRFTVADDGPGFDPATKARLFDRAFQAPGSDRRGLGLGLAIAKGIVAAHGSKLEVEGAPGQGARFSFVLPFEAARARAFEL